MSMQAGSSKISSVFFNNYNDELQASALLATKASTSLPPDVPFHRSVDGEFGKLIDSTSEKALRLTNKLLNLVSNSSKRKGKSKLEAQDDVVDRFESLVVDVMDQLFERADTNLDKLHGRVTTPSIPAAPIPSKSSTQKPRLEQSLVHAAHIAKPQLKFSRAVDNQRAWSPHLKHKYNAQVPLGYNLSDEMDEMDVDSVPRLRHPYEYELKHLSYPQCMFEHCDPTAPGSFDEVPMTWVASADVFKGVLNKIRKAQEIAVDLEYHNYRTFAGFVCLIQISTREEDFILDALELREELQELNEVFTDPKIVKVFHGAESDIVWLQQNFNVYVVNLFDTYHASRELDFPKHGLAALLEMYCDFIPDKRYQLADWRIRPLPEAMLNYARSDTHFLLFIYDNLRNVLLDRSGGAEDSIRNVLARSRDTALRVYESELYDFETGSGPGGWVTLLQKWNKSLSGASLSVFRAVHRWRDRLARKEDESTRYILPNHFIFQLAERPPSDQSALMAIFRPVPPLVRINATSLLDVIKAALHDAPSKSFVSNSIPATTAASTAAPPKASESSRTVLADSYAVMNEATENIWSSAESYSAPGSTLLGVAPSIPMPGSRTETAQSSLFPSGWSMQSKAPVKSSSRYHEVVCKIHGAMGVIPTVPSIVSDAATEPTIKSPETAIDEVPGQIEIPFVPSGQRVHIREEISDTIVVVGQGGKKRKRATGKETSPSKKTKDDPRDDIEPFDYESAPNLLDGPTSRESVKDEKVERRKKAKGSTLSYGDFPAPPRANNEVKSGNQSHTFR